MNKNEIKHNILISSAVKNIEIKDRFLQLAQRTHRSISELFFGPYAFFKKALPVRHTIHFSLRRDCSGEPSCVRPDLPLHLALTLALHGLEQGFQALHLHIPVIKLPPQVVDGDAVAGVPVPQTLILLLLQTQLLLSFMKVSLQEVRYAPQVVLNNSRKTLIFLISSLEFLYDLKSLSFWNLIFLTASEQLYPGRIC